MPDDPNVLNYTITWEVWERAIAAPAYYPSHMMMSPQQMEDINKFITPNSRVNSDTDTPEDV